MTTSKYTSEFVARFWSRVDKSQGKDACWIWAAGRNADGYGSIRIPAIGTRSAHRIAWELINGELSAGQQVLHNCPNGDNPSCVNPHHMFLGDPLANAHDRDSKGRRTPPKGEGHASHKLTDKQVAEIRRLRNEEHLAFREIGRIFSVSDTHIRRIIKRVNRN